MAASSMALLRPAKREWSVMPTPEQLAQIDLANKSSLAGTLWAADIAVIVIVALVVSLRIGVRAVDAKRFFLDDYLIILAAVLTLGLTATTLVATNHGLGQHVWNLELATLFAQVKRCVQLMFVAQILYAFAIALTKLSILASYLRIFPDPRLRTLIIYTAGFTVAFCIVSVLVTIFQCSPVNAAWEFDIPGSSCYPYVDFLYASAAIHVLTDIIICVMPLPYFWNLQLPKKQKIIVSGLFVVGGFACIASIIRISYLHMLNGIDVTYNVVNSLIWAIVECSVGIVCVSLPPIRPLVVRVLPSYFKTTVAASRYGGGFSVGGTFAGAAGANSALGGSRRPSAAASVARDGVDDRDDIELQRQGREKDGCGSASPRSCSSDGTDLEKGHADAGICVSPAPGAVLASDRSKIISRQHSLTHHNHHEQKHHHNDAEEAQAGRSSQ